MTCLRRLFVFSSVFLVQYIPTKSAGYSNNQAVFYNTAYDTEVDPACGNCSFQMIFTSGEYAPARCSKGPAELIYLTVLSNYKANWFRAQEDCERNGMKLKTFLSVTEQRQIGAQIVKSACVIGDRSNGSVWSGHSALEYIAKPGPLPNEAWTGLSGRPLNEEMWDRSRGPNPSRSLVVGCGSFTFESCIEMIITTDPKTSSTFNDADCYLEKFFVCEKTYKLTTPTYSVYPEERRKK